MSSNKLTDIIGGFEIRSFFLHSNGFHAFLMKIELEPLKGRKEKIELLEGV